MITLTLTTEEQEILAAMLDCQLSDIHSEIVHCDNLEYKKMLKSRKDLLVNLLNRLKSSES
jgi:hypothetical protein